MLRNYVFFFNLHLQPGTRKSSNPLSGDRLDVRGLTVARETRSHMGSVLAGFTCGLRVQGRLNFRVYGLGALGLAPGWPGCRFRWPQLRFEVGFRFASICRAQVERLSPNPKAYKPTAIPPPPRFCSCLKLVSTKTSEQSEPAEIHKLLFFYDKSGKPALKAEEPNPEASQIAPQTLPQSP